MFMYNMYWLFHIAMIAVAISIAYSWNKIKESETTVKYIAFSLICFYLCCGPFYCIFQTSHDIEQAKEYKEYQHEIIIPVQEQYNNTTLPDGYYYLGCEIVDIQKEVVDGEYEYIYSFGVVDCDGRNDVYVYSTYQMLNPDVPYLLVMDSLTTNDTTDDVINVVWACIE